MRTSCYSNVNFLLQNRSRRSGTMKLKRTQSHKPYRTSLNKNRRVTLSFRQQTILWSEGVRYYVTARRRWLNFGLGARFSYQAEPCIKIRHYPTRAIQAVFFTTLKMGEIRKVTETFLFSLQRRGRLGLWDPSAPDKRALSQSRSR
jgi:hypothetical protein